MRALSRNTRRVTALTLAAALVIAVYLNWQYARTDTGIAADEEAQVVSAEPVQSDTVLDGLPTEAETVSAANKNYGEAQLVSGASDSGARFFEEARLKREKAHDEAMDALQKTMKSSSLSAEEKKDCTAQLTAGLEDLHAENERYRKKDPRRFFRIRNQLRIVAEHPRERTRKQHDRRPHDRRIDNTRCKYHPERRFDACGIFGTVVIADDRHDAGLHGPQRDKEKCLPLIVKAQRRNGLI